MKVMGLTGHKSQVACVALSADNRRAATASRDGMLKVGRAVKRRLDSSFLSVSRRLLLLLHTRVPFRLASILPLRVCRTWTRCFA